MFQNEKKKSMSGHFQECQIGTLKLIETILFRVAFLEVQTITISKIV